MGLGLLLGWGPGAACVSLPYETAQLLMTQCPSMACLLLCLAFPPWNTKALLLIIWMLFFLKDGAWVPHEGTRR
jgi:hypothetical protein